MRLVSYRTNGSTRAGFLADDTVVDAAVASGAAGADTSGVTLRSVRGLLSEHPSQLVELAELAELAGLAKAAVTCAAHDKGLEDVWLAARVPDPQKILCLGLNYRLHAEIVGLLPTNTWLSSAAAGGR